MQTVTRENWTDERLDEFGKRMDERFDAVHREMRREFEQVGKRLDRLGDGLEIVQRALIFGSISMSTAFVAGFVTLAVKI